MTKYMSDCGGSWLEHTSKGNRRCCGFIWINFGLAIFFSICGYQNLVPSCIGFLDKLAQIWFNRWGGLVLPVGRVLEARRRTREQQASCIRVRMKFGKNFLIVSCQWTCTLVRSPFLIFAFRETRIVGLIST